MLLLVNLVLWYGYSVPVAHNSQLLVMGEGHVAAVAAALLDLVVARENSEVDPGESNDKFETVRERCLGRPRDKRLNNGDRDSEVGLCWRVTVVSVALLCRSGDGRPFGLRFRNDKGPTSLLDSLMELG